VALMSAAHGEDLMDKPFQFDEATIAEVIRNEVWKNHVTGKLQGVEEAARTIFALRPPEPRAIEDT
jgi:hypothetical protein